MERWTKVSEEGIKRLHQLAEESKGIEVIPSEPVFNYHLSFWIGEEEKAFRTDAVAEILKKYAKRDNLVWTEVSRGDLLSLKNVSVGAVGFTTIDFVNKYAPKLVIREDSGRLVEEKYLLTDLLDIVMRENTGRVYYIRRAEFIVGDYDPILKDSKKKVFTFAIPCINRIDENSEVLAIIQPEFKEGKATVVTSKEYIRSGNVYF